MSTTYNNNGPIYITTEKYNSLVSAGTVETGREYVIVDATQPVTDVQINGTTVTSSGVANVPIASTTSPGVAYFVSNLGIDVNSSSGSAYISAADYSIINTASNTYKPIVPGRQGLAVKKSLGVTVTSSTSNTEWTDAEATTARNTIGAITLEEYDSTATPVAGVLYYSIED